MPHQLVLVTSLALAFAGCFAGKPKNGPECDDREDIHCDSGYVCVDFECRLRCDVAEQCGPAEACSGGVCLPYSESCVTHPDCEQGFYCLNQACVKKHPLGTACGAAVACASGFCTDNVCCDGDCTGECRSCARGQAGDGDDGACTDVAAREDPDGDCAGATFCDGSGRCFAKTPGATCAADGECESGTCRGGVCCATSCGPEPCWSCAAAHTGAALGQCAPIPDGQDPLQCAGPVTCDGAGSCYNRDLGQSCAAGRDDQCLSGLCVDGVCCDSPCDAICQNCNLATAPGLCTSVVDGPDAGGCDAATMAGNCTLAPCTCDTTSTCTRAAGQACTAGTECPSPNVCLGGICCSDSCAGTCMSCNGDHTGQPHGTCDGVRAGLDPFNQCAGASTSLACSGDAACYAGTTSPPSTCTYAYQCLSGFCVDGYCCNAACNGTCVACDGVFTTGAAGDCSNVEGGQDPDNECAGGASCSGTGQCFNGQPGDNCQFGYECVSGDCCGGKCTYGWTQMPGVPATADLNAIWGTSATDLFAVGAGGVILRYNGSTWQTMTSNTSNALNGVWGSSGTNILAVGGNRTVMRYNGTSWASANSGVPTGAVLNDVWVSSDTLAYAVGNGGVILRWNGTSWSSMTSGTTVNLYDIDGSSGTIFAGGGMAISDGIGGSCDGRVLRLDGSTWTDLAVDGLCVGSVVGGATPAVVASGVSIPFMIGCGSAEIRENSGATWNSVAVGHIVRSLWRGADSIYGLGVCVTSYFGCQAAVYTRSDTGWTYRFVDAGSVEQCANLHSVWGANDCSIFAVGDGGTVLRK